MRPRLTESELSELRVLIANQVDDLLDEEALPSDAVGLERIALIAAAPARDAHGPAEVADAFVAALERRGDRDAATLLAAMAFFAPQIARVAEAALGRLRESKVKPALPEGFGGLHVVEARRGKLAEEVDLYALLMERAGSDLVQVACVVVECEDEAARVLSKCVVTGPLEPDAETSVLDELDFGDSQQPPGLRPVAVEVANRAFREAIEYMRELDIAASGELAIYLPLLACALCDDVAALDGIPLAAPGEELFVDQHDEEAFGETEDQLLADFERWLDMTGAAAPAHRNGTFVAGAMIEWRWGYVDGRLGYWTIEDLEKFFLEHVPRKFPADEELIEDAPDCAAAFMRFLDDANFLGGDPVDELVARCESIREEVAEVAADRSRWGPAKALTTQMRQEGVNVTDQEAIDAWLRDFNSRPRRERDKVVGPAMDRQLAVAVTGESDAPLPSEIDGALQPWGDAGQMAFAISWFQARDYGEALERWKELSELWGAISHPEYCKRIEATLRGWQAHGVRPKLVPLRMREYLAWCAGQGEDPAEARAGYAAEMLHLGRADRWPPGRNELCWCGSESKYKKCCGSVSSSTLHSLEATL